LPLKLCSLGGILFQDSLAGSNCLLIAAAPGNYALISVPVRGALVVSLNGCFTAKRWQQDNLPINDF